MGAGRFRYPLDALLRKRRADWTTARLEEAGAASLVRDRQAEARRAQDEVAGAEQGLRDARRGGVRIDAAREQLWSEYLGHQRGVLVQREQALQRAREMYERVRGHLEQATRGVKALEKHRSGREDDHRAEQGRIEQNGLDELALLCRHRRSN